MILLSLLPSNFRDFLKDRTLKDAANWLEVKDAIYFLNFMYECT